MTDWLPAGYDVPVSEGSEQLQFVIAARNANVIRCGEVPNGFWQEADGESHRHSGNALIKPGPLRCAGIDGLCPRVLEGPQ